jgi:hypothetical protein
VLYDAKRRAHTPEGLALSTIHGDRRTKDRLTGEQRAFNRLQAGLRALVEQTVGHLACAWSLRRWRGLLYRLREVFRAAGALVCLGRWRDRVPGMTKQHREPHPSGCRAREGGCRPARSQPAAVAARGRPTMMAAR